MKKILFFTFFMFSSIFIQAQSLQWNQTVAHSVINYVGGISCDSSNNIYLTGRMCKNGYGNGYNGIFREKYDSFGSLIWSDTTLLAGAYRYASSSGDKQGNTYISFSCSTDFTIGDSLVDFPSSASSNGCFVKSDCNSNIVWTVPMYRASPRTTVMHNNLLYVCGYALGSANIKGTYVPSGGFIAKFDLNGNCLGVINTGSTATVSNSGVDSLGNIYVQINTSSYSQLLKKYNSNDSLLWSITLPGVQITGMGTEKCGN